jgi:hypothetical protein
MLAAGNVMISGDDDVEIPKEVSEAGREIAGTIRIACRREPQRPNGEPNHRDLSSINSDCPSLMCFEMIVRTLGGLVE